MIFGKDRTINDWVSSQVEGRPSILKKLHQVIVPLHSHLPKNYRLRSVSLLNNMVAKLIGIVWMLPLVSVCVPVAAFFCAIFFLIKAVVHFILAKLYWCVQKAALLSVSASFNQDSIFCPQLNPKLLVYLFWADSTVSHQKWHIWCSFIGTREIKAISTRTKIFFLWKLKCIALLGLKCIEMGGKLQWVCSQLRHSRNFFCLRVRHIHMIHITLIKRTQGVHNRLNATLQKVEVSCSEHWNKAPVPVTKQGTSTGKANVLMSYALIFAVSNPILVPSQSIPVIFYLNHVRRAGSPYSS